MLFARNALGIEIAQDGLKMALVGGKKGALRLDAFGIAPFPADTMRFSLKEPNVLNPEAFVAKVRETYLLLLGKTTRVSLSLPDAAGRVVILDLETRFRSRHEGADIIRWKLKKSFPFDVQEAHLDFQVLQEKDTGEISVLAALVSQQVVHQYEDLLVEAGLQPNNIDFTTFNMYRLFAERFDLSDDYVFLAFHSGVVSVLIFTAGVISFYRAKEMPGGPFDANRLFREISSSLLVYQEKESARPLKEVYYVVAREQRDAFHSVVSEATGLEPVWLDVGRLVSSGAGVSADGSAFHSLTGALGAAMRNL
jgi:type IV pilus assembly protein PilM